MIIIMKTIPNCVFDKYIYRPTFEHILRLDLFAIIQIH